MQRLPARDRWFVSLIWLALVSFGADWSGLHFMVGAFLAYIGVTQFGLNYWMMLVLAPLLVGLLGIVIERTMLRWLYKLDHIYGLLLTYGTLVADPTPRNGGTSLVMKDAGRLKVRAPALAPERQATQVAQAVQAPDALHAKADLPATR